MILRCVASLLVAVLALSSVSATAQKPWREKSFDEVSQAFDKADADTRVSIAEHWAKSRETRATPFLERALRVDQSPLVRTKAAFALGALSALGALGTLQQAVTGDNESRVRYMAAWALGRIGSREGVGALTRALGDKDVSVRARAAASLGQVNDRSAVAPLFKALQDPAKQVRTAAVVALQKLGVADAEIRSALPADDRAGALTADRKSQGVGVALGLVGAGLLYAGKPLAGWTTLALELAGVGLMLVGYNNGAFKTESVCLTPGPSGCQGLPVQQDLHSGYKALFITGAIVAAGAWLTSVVATPIAITHYNQRLEEARQARLRLEPYLDLRADAKIFGATLRF
jgi:hypothetical protein